MNNFEKHDLTNLVGKHLIYTYENGWQHEIYIKNDINFKLKINNQ
ncbi:phenolic acid decarboxylase [Arsenophonus sp. PmNCSU2021_1]